MGVAFGPDPLQKLSAIRLRCYIQPGDKPVALMARPRTVESTSKIVNYMAVGEVMVWPAPRLSRCVRKPELCGCRHRLRNYPGVDRRRQSHNGIAITMRLFPAASGVRRYAGTQSDAAHQAAAVADALVGFGVKALWLISTLLSLR